jgi:hypothetical protein
MILSPSVAYVRRNNAMELEQDSVDMWSFYGRVRVLLIILLTLVIVRAKIINTLIVGVVFSSS